MSRRPEPAVAPRVRGPAIAYGVLLTIGLMAALFPWFPGGSRLAEGRIVDRAIVAPRDV